MKLFSLTMVTATALATGTVAFAQASAATSTPAAPGAAAPVTAAGPLKLATIAFNAAVFQTNEAQVNFNTVRSKFAPKEAELKNLSDEVDNLKKQIQASGDKLSQAERDQRLKTIDTKEKQLQRSTEDAQNDFQNESGQAFQTIAEKVFNFLQTYAQQNGYTLVLDRGTPQSPIVWYADNATDITQAVIQAYNQKSGIAAPATSSAPSAPSATRPVAPTSTHPAATGTTTPRPAGTTPKP